MGVGRVGSRASRALLRDGVIGGHTSGIYLALFEMWISSGEASVESVGARSHASQL